MRPCTHKSTKSLHKGCSDSPGVIDRHLLLISSTIAMELLKLSDADAWRESSFQMKWWSVIFPPQENEHCMVGNESPSDSALMYLYSQTCLAGHSLPLQQRYKVLSNSVSGHHPMSLTAHLDRSYSAEGLWLTLSYFFHPILLHMTSELWANPPPPSSPLPILGGLWSASGNGLSMPW